jgi:hypothetical protein
MTSIEKWRKDCDTEFPVEILMSVQASAQCLTAMTYTKESESVVSDRLANELSKSQPISSGRFQSFDDKNMIIAQKNVAGQK